APVVALPMGRRREFEGRLLAILDPALRRQRPTAAHASVLVAFCLGAGALAAVAPMEAADDPGATPASARQPSWIEAAPPHDPASGQSRLSLDQSDPSQEAAPDQGMKGFPDPQGPLPAAGPRAQAEP